MATRKDNGIENEGWAEDKSPVKGEAYGIAAVTAAFEGVDFPMEKKELLEKVDRQTRIPWTQNHTIDLYEVIEGLPINRFSSVTELTQSISESVKSTKR